ncbi:hypothetical protein BT96DRAFT_917928 [Gymnopus androsaceus JB14]|uniref:Uncharacterized protein n=1 Tax=Gymnopus androsaceus JB14 TaxID=1447944 RepID=A0A6A4I069_9AGAR|nr:hypothetical protein BT96DRAFT_917928 [Gymnopus androsaceus JB14]
MTGETTRRSGVETFTLGNLLRAQAFRPSIEGTSIPFEDPTKNLELAKHNRNPDGNISGATFIDVNVVQETQEEEESTFANGPAVFKRAKGITFDGVIMAQGAFSAVGGSMYIGGIPEASISSDSDATPRFSPSVMEGAEDVEFKPGTQVGQGAMSAVGGDMIIDPSGQ